jgi:flagellar protein FlgJ
MSRADFGVAAFAGGPSPSDASGAGAVRAQASGGLGRSGSIAGGGLYSEVQADVVAFIEHGSRGEDGGGYSRGSASAMVASAGTSSGWSGASGFASMAPSSWPVAVQRALGGSTSASTQGSASTASGGQPAATNASGVGSGGTGVSAEAQREFLDQIAPYALKTGERLGVAPEIVAAQAALESGWGRKPLRRADGSDAHNLFGLKAGGAWTGEVTQAATHEQSGDDAVTRVEPFRSYGDVSGGFDDYASLLADHPRYRAALGTGSDARAFASALAQGGYASDPAYADKLVRLTAQVRASRGSGR